jgi:hypothetical protein
VVNGADDQFEKYGMNVIDQLNEPYDYASVGCYFENNDLSIFKLCTTGRLPSLPTESEQLWHERQALKKWVSVFSLVS